MSRKMREAILAIRIDATYPKDKMLELYLNEIYLGQNSYGVGGGGAELFRQVAGRARHRRSRLPGGAAQGAQPITIRVFITTRRCDRRNWVIGQMADNGYITDAQAEAAKAEPLVTQTPRLGQPGRGRRLLCRGSAPPALQAVWRQGALRWRPAGARLARHAAAELCGERVAHRPGAL